MLCTGCGTCCRNGGPILHGDDAPLVLQGHLPLSRLVTLRRGESAHDPVAGRVLPLDEEVIKIAGTGEAAYPWHCVFHTATDCGVYDHRPLQCQALFCKDTSSLEALYEKDRLDRWRILLLLRKHSPERLPEGLMELAQAHEEQCPVTPLRELVPAAPQDDAAAGALLEAVRFDIAFRDLAVERGHIDAALLPFALGRPLTRVLRSLGLEVRQDAQGAGLTLHRTRATLG